MKRDGKYRFSLQFSNQTEENREAGELLERMGNKKSAVVVAALNEYRRRHPEIQYRGKNPMSFVPIFDRRTEDTMTCREKGFQDKKEMVRISGGSQDGRGISYASERPVDAVREQEDDDISVMLDNLELFHANSC